MYYIIAGSFPSTLIPISQTAYGLLLYKSSYVLSQKRIQKKKSHVMYKPLDPAW